MPRCLLMSRCLPVATTSRCSQMPTDALPSDLDHMIPVQLKFFYLSSCMAHSRCNQWCPAHPRLVVATIHCTSPYSLVCVMHHGSPTQYPGDRNLSYPQHGFKLFWNDGHFIKTFSVCLKESLYWCIGVFVMCPVCSFVRFEFPQVQS